MNNPKSGKEAYQQFNKTGEQIRQERSKLKAEYGKLYDAVSEILFRHDPIGINFGHNTDEYEPEVRTILLRLNDCTSVSHARKAIHQEFVRWFDLDSAGPEARYEEIAEEVWAAWQEYQRDRVAGTVPATRAQILWTTNMLKEGKSTGDKNADLPILPFARQKDWAVWLDKNHATSSGVWLKLAKKASGVQSVTYDEALEAALCYGWIDGQKKSYDETSWLQKFTPRGPKSIWSKINTEKAQRLIESGKMKPAGLKAVENARQDGRWDAAYASPSKAVAPDDLQAALDRNAKARAFFATLDSRNRYAILHRIHTAKKTETRAKRIEQFVRMLEKKEKIYP